jgi:MOSC domain-containing protein YiiM
MATIHQISSSDGGVPKLAIPSARIDERGVVGDRQADLRYHGAPHQALCLYSLEVIEALQAEGHPIAPGSAGENITIAGLDWADLREGDRIDLGKVVAQLSSPTAPCKKNAGWFINGEFRRMSHSEHPGWSRWYARVLTGGDIAVGDLVSLRRTDA